MSTAAGEIIIAIPDGKVPSARMVTPQSYLIDRIEPACEIIALPERRVAGGELRIHCGEIRAAPPAPGGLRSRLMRRTPPNERVPQGHIAIDLRHHLDGNWAHMLNNHLPLSFRMLEATGVGWDKALILLPADAPRYIHAAAALFGLDTHATDAVVEGQGLAFSMEPRVGQRAARADWVRLADPARALSATLAGAPPGQPLPQRVFLSRKDTRVPSNATEVEAFLRARGFETVYPEDLSASDQMHLFAGAEEMVAVHGAGLAPLLYCGASAGLEGGPRRLIEILPCGHVTDVYRVIADRVGCAWIGVRGRLKPEYVRPAHDIGAGFSKFSLDSFEVDVAALEEAFALSDAVRRRTGEAG